MVTQTITAAHRRWGARFVSADDEWPPFQAKSVAWACTLSSSGSKATVSATATVSASMCSMCSRPLFHRAMRASGKTAFPYNARKSCARRWSSGLSDLSDSE